jgi:hypothetical protein
MFCIECIPDGALDGDRCHRYGFGIGFFSISPRTRLLTGSWSGLQASVSCCTQLEEQEMAAWTSLDL